MNTTALQTIGDYSVVTTTKTGKETRRDMLGVVSSGNRAARDNAAQTLVTHQFCAGQFGMLASNMARIFGNLFVNNSAFVGLNPVTGGAADKSKKSARAAWADIIQGFQTAHETKPLKGEKLLWVTMLHNAQLTYEAQSESRAAALAAQAAVVAAGLIDVVATTVEPLQITNESERVNADAEVV